jgi:peptide/nickel transport system ATP-binding protein
MTEALVNITDLSVSYGHRQSRHVVLRDLSAQIQPGQIVGLIGETGSGKTTLARTLLGLAQVDSGSVSVAGTEIARLSTQDARRYHRSGVVQYVFQDPLQSLDPDLTIYQSLTESLVIRGVRDRDRLELEALEALREVALPERVLRALPRNLSGGQRQRAVIARALISHPRLLLLDEPVSALDAHNRIRMLDLFVQVRDELGIAQVFISHDLGSIASITDEIWVLHGGTIVERGPTEQVILEPSHPYTRRLVESAPRLAS